MHRLPGSRGSFEQASGKDEASQAAPLGPRQVAPLEWPQPAAAGHTDATREALRAEEESSERAQLKKKDDLLEQLSWKMQQMCAQLKDEREKMASQREQFEEVQQREAGLREELLAKNSALQDLERRNKERLTAPSTRMSHSTSPPPPASRNCNAHPHSTLSALPKNDRLTSSRPTKSQNREKEEMANNIALTVPEGERLPSTRRPASLRLDYHR